MPAKLIALVFVAVLAVLFLGKLLVFHLFERMVDGSAYTARRAAEEKTREVADWIGTTGLDEGTERELPRYLRRELGEFLDDPQGLKAADLHYLGIHRDERGAAHFWRMPARGNETSFAYIEIDDSGNPSSYGWGDRQPQTAAVR